MLAPDVQPMVDAPKSARRPRSKAVLPILIGSTLARHLTGFAEDASWLTSMVDTVWKGIAAD